jgi:transcriptional regulator with PAS, ATPase and Fis domain
VGTVAVHSVGGRRAPTPDKFVEPVDFAEIDGTCRAIEALKVDMRRVAADAHVTVLVLGESGTGKERVARAIHLASPRARSPFIVVNCAGLAPTLVEDELFGHVRGAFTGAIADQPGPFERADGGTVFLDEVGELTLDLQIKLLRALQQRVVLRLGGRRETPFDVRVIAATNVDLARSVARGRFRQDLYYRLKVYELRVPPLRSRGSADLKQLAAAVLDRLAARRGRRSPALDDGVWAVFENYSWPGNVRELENTLERMMVAAAGAAVCSREHLPEEFGAGESRRIVGSEPSASEIVTALERAGFHRGRAAGELGFSRHQLYRRLKAMGGARPEQLSPTREGASDRDSSNDARNRA